MHNPMATPLWHIPLKRKWHNYCGNAESLTLIPIVEQTSMRYVAGVFIQANRFGGYPSALATARAIVQAHNKAVKAARKEFNARKTQASDS